MLLALCFYWELPYLLPFSVNAHPMNMMQEAWVLKFRRRVAEEARQFCSDWATLFKECLSTARHRGTIEHNRISFVLDIIIRSNSWSWPSNMYEYKPNNSPHAFTNTITIVNWFEFKFRIRSREIACMWTNADCTVLGSMLTELRPRTPNTVQL